MAFWFSLQALLRLRRSYEQRERLRLLALTAALSRLRTRLEEIAAERLRIHRSQQASLAAGTSGAELHLLRSAIARQAENQKIVEEQIRVLEQQLHVQQLAYREAQKNRKILENLRDHQFELYKRQLERREQHALDDLIILRHVRGLASTLLPGE